MTATTARTVKNVDPTTTSVDTFAPKMSQETITPSEAKLILEHNNNGNRKLRPRVVSQYARDMVAGKWQLNGDSVRFDRSGNLIDGQHRLMACVQADVPLETFVFKGVSSSALINIDTGAKRNLQNVLHYEGYSKNLTQLAASIRWCYMYDLDAMDQHRSYSDGSGNITQVPTINELLDWIKANKNLVNAVNFYRHGSAPFSGADSAMIGIQYYAGESGFGHDYLAFHEAVVNGGNLSEGNPILTLRRWLEWNSLRAGRLRNIKTTHAIIVKGWNAYMRGEEPKSLNFRPGGASPEKFPRIYIPTDS